MDDEIVALKAIDVRQKNIVGFYNDVQPQQVGLSETVRIYKGK